MPCQFLINFFDGVANDTLQLDITSQSVPAPMTVLTAVSVASPPTTATVPMSVPPTPVGGRTGGGFVFAGQKPISQSMQSMHPTQSMNSAQMAMPIPMESASLNPNASAGMNTGSRANAISNVADAELEEHIIQRFVNKLIAQKIYLVCFDYDDTIINTKELSQEQIMATLKGDNFIYAHTSPLFFKLGTALLKHGIRIAIATYNGNPQIASAMTNLFGTHVPVYARADHLIETGKLWHLGQAIGEYNYRMKLTGKDGIRSHNVLLVDDSPINTDAAALNLYHVINNPRVISMCDIFNYLGESQ